MNDFMYQLSPIIFGCMSQDSRTLMSTKFCCFIVNCAW